MHEQENVLAMQIYLQIPTHRLTDLQHTSTPKSVNEKSRTYNPTLYTIYAENKKIKKQVHMH